MDICELSLTETRLVERPGTEITFEEFDQVWSSYGGKSNVIYRAKSKH